jgi:hypothetical protein
MKKQSIKNQIFRRIVHGRPGRAYCASDFKLGVSQRAVNQALHRLAQEGVIRRVAQGIYERPRIHPKFGPMPPNLEEVARASLLKVEGRGAKLQLSGAAAANTLGLSEQVPARTVYLTTGLSRVVNVEVGEWRQTIEFRHVEPGQLQQPGRVAESVLQAMRFLGKEGMEAFQVAELVKMLPAKERRNLARASVNFPTWIHVALSPALVSTQTAVTAT